MLIVLAELKVSVSNCEKMSYKIASRLRFSRADGTYKDVGTVARQFFSRDTYLRKVQKTSVRKQLHKDVM